jgi:hypothetical protein
MPNKIYHDCQLKGKILNAISHGQNTAKLIFTAVQYPHHIDSLYRELNFLRTYGYLKKHKGAETSYSLTKKGRIHAFNPTLFKDAKNNRFNKDLTDTVEGILENDDKFNDAVKKYADKNLSRPIIENIIKSPEIGIDGHSVEILGDLSNPETLEKNLPALQNSIIKAPNGMQISNAFWEHLLKDSKEIVELKKKNADLEDEIEKLKNQKIPASIPAYTLSTQKPSANCVSTSSNTRNVLPDDVVKSKEFAHKQKMDALALKRKQLAQEYYGYQIDANFFRR